MNEMEKPPFPALPSLEYSPSELGERLALMPMELVTTFFQYYRISYDIFSLRVLNKFWSKNWTNLLQKYEFCTPHDPAFMKNTFVFLHVSVVKISLGHLSESEKNADSFIPHLLRMPKLQSFSLRSSTDYPSAERNLIAGLEENGHKLKRLYYSIYRYPRDPAAGDQVLRAITQFCLNLEKLTFAEDATDLSAISNLKKLVSLNLRDARADDLNTILLPDSLRRLEAEYAPLARISSDVLKNASHLERLVLDAGNIERDDTYPGWPSWLDSYMTEVVQQIDKTIPASIGLNCWFSINISRGQADWTDIRTLLELAVQMGSDKWVETLIRSGSSPEASCSEPNLAKSISCGDIQMARTLIASGHRVLPFLDEVLKAFNNLWKRSDRSLVRLRQSKLCCATDAYSDEEDVQEDEVSEEVLLLRKRAEDESKFIREESRTLFIDILTKYGPQEAQNVGKYLFSDYFNEKNVVSAVEELVSNPEIEALCNSVAEVRVAAENRKRERASEAPPPDASGSSWI